MKAGRLGTRSLQKMRDLAQHDWDFRPVADSELVACCYYEFARESDTLVNYYDLDIRRNLKKLGATYRAKVKGRVLALPHPIKLPWNSIAGSEFPRLEFVGRGWKKPFLVFDGYVYEKQIKFADTPWQSQNPKFRQWAVKAYEEIFTHKGFSPADFVRITQDIISHGDSRSGLDPEKGIERIAVEIDWAAFDDSQLVASFREWVAVNRPPGIGQKNLKGKGKLRDWRARLKRLAVARLLSRCKLRQLPARYPEAWEWLRTSGKWKAPVQTVSDLYNQGERDIYHLREQAAEDFRELFPFLPSQEKPRFETEKEGRK
ncbi:MAG: hypothetical protein ABSF38_20325 [Verrucomicrobiota bacterium]